MHLTKILKALQKSTILAILFASQAAWCQIHAEDALFKQMTASEKSYASGSQVALLQVGFSNEAYIQQVNASNANAEVLQAGIANVIDLNQVGYSISTRIVQLGADNFYHGDIEGNEVSLNFAQLGYGNTISQSSLMINTGFSIIQEGDRNEIVQTGELSNTMGIKIHQQGYGMKLIMKSN
jgi:hypothetical protein